MSFARSRILPLARQTRFFSTSPFRASVLDTAKETVKNVDRTVSNAAVKGIEKAGMSPLPPSLSRILTHRHLPFPFHFMLKPFQHLAYRKCTIIVGFGTNICAEQTTQEVREAAGMNAEGLRGKAQEMAGEAKGKANEMAGEAGAKKEQMKGKANEMAGEAGAKKEQMKGEAMGKKEEMKGQAVGKKEEIKSKI